MLNKYCIVRAKAGVFAGTIDTIDGNTVAIRDVRRLWYWHAARGHSLSGVAVNGLNHDKSKIPAVAARVLVYEVIEILEVTETAKESIISCPVFQP